MRWYEYVFLHTDFWYSREVEKLEPHLVHGSYSKQFYIHCNCRKTNCLALGVWQIGPAPCSKTAHMGSPMWCPVDTLHKTGLRLLRFVCPWSWGIPMSVWYITLTSGNGNWQGWISSYSEYSGGFRRMQCSCYGLSRTREGSLAWSSSTANVPPPVHSCLGW